MEKLLEEIKKAKIDLIWEMIEEWQSARDGDDINEPRFSFQDIEVDLYEWMNKVDPKAASQPKLEGKEKQLIDCLEELVRELELFYGNGKYDGDMRNLFTKAKSLLNK